MYGSAKQKRIGQRRIILEESARTAEKAAIKRASAKARRNMQRLDAETAKALTRIYTTALEAMRADIRAFSPDGSPLQLEIMADMVRQMEQRLAALKGQRDSLMNSQLFAAADEGVNVMQTAAVATQLTQVADDAVRFVTNFVAEDGLTLSARLWKIDQGARRAVQEAVEQAVIQGHGASQAAADFLRRGVSVPADVADAARAAEPGRIEKTLGDAFMRSEMGPYEQAKRVFRTELNRAHSEAYEASVQNHPDAIGTRFLLSPNHPRRDICDLHASVNRYGLGPGVYPFGKNPLPAHPNTLSFKEVVFRDEVTDEDRAGKQDRIDWLKSLPVSEQEQIIGKAKAAAMRAGHLKENGINMPWKTIKQRLEKKGVDVKTLEESIEPAKTR